MDKLKYSIFDFYTYFIPGSLIVFTGYLFLANLLGQDFNFFIEHMKEMSIKLLFVFIPFSFLTGMVISDLSSFISDLRKHCCKKDINGKNKTISEMPISTFEIVDGSIGSIIDKSKDIKKIEKTFSSWFHKAVGLNEIDLTFYKGESYVILREFSKENYNAIEQYNVYKTMCNNLIYSLVFCNVIFQYHQFNLIMVVLSIISCVVLYYSKIKFNNWGRNEIEACIKLLFVSTNYKEIINDYKNIRS